MLFYSGKTSRIGNVDEGDTVTDYLPSERQRGITIQLAAISIPWNNNKINIIDTPGHADFTFEVIRSLRVLDGAVTILDGVAGVEAQTEKVWRQARALNIPRLAYVNKMDRDGAGFSRTVKEIIQKLQTRVVLCTVPYFETSGDGSPKLTGVLDVIHKKLLKWDPADTTGQTIAVSEPEGQSLEIIQKCRESMVETLGEHDEAVIEAFFETEEYMEVPSAVIDRAIRRATIDGYAVAVFCGSSFRNIGVQPLMDGIVKYLPSPLEIGVPELTTTKRMRKAKTSESSPVPSKMDPNKGLVVANNPNLTVALAFKVMTHATRGVMTFFRVYSGKLTSNTVAVNTRTGKKLRIRKLILMHGDEPEYVPYISSGNIGVISGSENDIITGDTIVSHGAVSKNPSDTEANMKLMPIEIPPPLFNSSLEPLTLGDARHMNSCIEILQREDPSMHVSVDEDLGQTIISGMGELHLEIIRDRLVNDMKARVRLRDVAVSYKESIVGGSGTSTSLGDEVSVTVEMDSFEGPAEDSQYATEPGAYLEDENNIIVLEPAATPSEMVQAVKDRRWKADHSLEDLQTTIMQGVATALQIGGPKLGLPLHSTVIRIKRWSFPFEDKGVPSSVLLDVSRRVVRQHLEDHYESRPQDFTILEPYMQTRVYVNSDTLGEVTHDLNARCQAVITSIDDESGENLDALNWARALADSTYVPPDYTIQRAGAGDVRNQKIISAETPLREMVGYLSRLRSITQGRGTFDMTFLEMRRTSKSRCDDIVNSYSV